MSPELILVIILAVMFDFLNGVHDSSNIVATMIASRAFQPALLRWRSRQLLNF